MQTLAEILPYIQVVLSILLMVVILLQQSGSELGGAFGGGDGGGIKHTRRGFERMLFWSTSIIAILFAISAFTALVI